MTGYILALISSFFFGLYVVPRKLTNINPLHFSLLMSAGFFIGSAALYLLQPIIQFHETINKSLNSVPYRRNYLGGIVSFAYTLD